MKTNVLNKYVKFNKEVFIYVYWLEAEGAVVPQHCLKIFKTE